MRLAPFVGETEMKLGLACVEHTNLRTLSTDAGPRTLNATAVSDFQWCPGAPVDGELSLASTE